jgi:hypothetical protein
MVIFRAHSNHLNSVRYAKLTHGLRQKSAAS